MKIKRELFGVLSKTSQGFILFTHKSELNFTQELKNIWQLAIPVHIKIETEDIKLLHENDCEIYLDRDSQRKYKYHVNDINIEDVLESAIGKQLYINISYITSNIDRKDNYNDAGIHNKN